MAEVFRKANSSHLEATDAALGAFVDRIADKQKNLPLEKQDLRTLLTNTAPWMR